MSDRRSVELVYSPDDFGYYWSRHTGLHDEVSVALYPTEESARKALRNNRVMWERS